MPDDLAELLDNVAIVVDDWPDGSSAYASDTLYGLYEGVPLTKRDFRLQRRAAGQDHDLPGSTPARLRHARRAGRADQDNRYPRGRPPLRLRRGTSTGAGLGLGRRRKGVSQDHSGSVRLEQSIEAPAEKVAAYVADFRNSKNWMVGVESVEPLGEDSYRVKLDTPVGKLEPGVRITGRGDRNISLGLHLCGGGRRRGRGKAGRRRLRHLLYWRLPAEARAPE